MVVGVCKVSKMVFALFFVFWSVFQVSTMLSETKCGVRVRVRVRPNNKIPAGMGKHFQVHDFAHSIAMLMIITIFARMMVFQRQLQTVFGSQRQTHPLKHVITAKKEGNLWGRVYKGLTDLSHLQRLGRRGKNAGIGSRLEVSGEDGHFDRHTLDFALSRGCSLAHFQKGDVEVGFAWG
jgi:hypothetical protein